MTKVEQKCRTCGGRGILYRCHDAHFGCYGHFVGLDLESVACADCQGTEIHSARQQSRETQAGPPEQE